MSADGPAERYYRSLAGDWFGALEIQIHDHRTLWLSSLPLGMRLAWALSGAGGKIFGAALMRTTLRQLSSETHSHTTRVSMLGKTVLFTEEQISIAPDGRSIRMQGRISRWPRLGQSMRYDAEGEIEDDALSACYRIPLFEAPLVQRTQVVPEGLRLVQETAWSRTSVLLQRSRPD